MPISSMIRSVFASMSDKPFLVEHLVVLQLAADEGKLHAAAGLPPRAPRLRPAARAAATPLAYDLFRVANAHGSSLPARQRASSRTTVGVSSEGPRARKRQSLPRAGKRPSAADPVSSRRGS